MSEGEFRKRIQKIKDDYHGYEGDSMFTAFEKLIPVLEEAKREFPKDTDEKYRDKLFTERNILLSGDRLAWFRRWFGE